MITLNFWDNGSLKMHYTATNLAEAYGMAYKDNEKDIKDTCDVFPEDKNWMMDAVSCWWDFEGAQIQVVDANEPPPRMTALYIVLHESGGAPTYVGDSYDEAQKYMVNSRMYLYRWNGEEWERR